MNEVDKSGKKIRKQLEVDFVCNKGSKRYYIQSAYALPDKAKIEQEQRSLIHTGDGFKKIIITKDGMISSFLTLKVFKLSITTWLTLKATSCFQVMTTSLFRPFQTASSSLRRRELSIS